MIFKLNPQSFNLISPKLAKEYGLELIKRKKEHVHSNSDIINRF
jgi:hypothetical protein